MATIPFWKMHGAGNDFILVYDKECSFPLQDTLWIQAIARRRTGVGCDGIILLQPSEKSHVSMTCINADGSVASMCGNGARCVALLAKDLDIAPAKMTIETGAGLLQALVREDRMVSIEWMDPKDIHLHRRITVQQETFLYHYIDTGVAHVVLEIDDIESVSLANIGKDICCHKDFYPDGTNVNFFSMKTSSSISVRTYERGVNRETLSCGTGMVACGTIACILERVVSPLQIHCRNGDTVSFTCKQTAEDIHHITLTGPAAYSYQGHLEYNQESN